MQDVNNDMDDLFRRAAEQYPLHTDGANWQKVAAGLQNDSMPVAEEKDKRKRRLLWLWLLFPLGFLWAVYYNSDNRPAQRIVIAKETAKDAADTYHAQDAGSESRHRAPAQAEGKTDSQTLSLPDEVQDDRKEVSSNKNKTAPEKVKKDIDIITSKSDNTLPGFGSKKSAYKNDAVNNRSGESARLKNKNGTDVFQQATAKADSEEIDNSKRNPASWQPGASSARIDNAGAAENRKEDNHLLQNRTDSIVRADSIVLTGIKKDSSANSSTGSETESKMVKAKPRVQNGFYAGLLASFDISTIKLQRINKTGYGFELLIGYRFSKRVSVESGINRTDKKYYSTGKYFDKTRTGIPPESKIIYTNGTCSMFEIPAAVKYDFAQRKKSNWFATAGLSSYIMKDETYTYYANHSGVMYTATKQYSHSGSNIFSIASLSFGYQLQLNKHLSLRAEPYIKMPLSGIGIAKMPITSAGITAGFTRSF